MKMLNLWIAVVFSMAVIAGCAGNPDRKTGPRDEGTAIEQGSEDLEVTVDSVAVMIDSATKAIDKSPQELKEMINDLKE